MLKRLIRKVENLQTKLSEEKKNKKAIKYFEQRSLLDLRFERHLWALDGYQYEPQTQTQIYATIRKGKQPPIISEI